MRIPAKSSRLYQALFLILSVKWSSSLSSSNSQSFGSRNLPVEILLSDPDSLSEAQQQLNSYRSQYRRRRKRSPEDSDQTDFKPDADTNQIQGDGTVVAVETSDSIDGKKIWFHRTVFDISQGHSHAYINWVGNGSPVIFVLSVKKRTISGRDIIDEAHLYRSDDYGKKWKQVVNVDDNGFPDTNKIFKYSPSPHDDKTLIFLDQDSTTDGSGKAQYKFITTTNAGVSFDTNYVSYLLDDVKFHPTEKTWLLGYSKVDQVLLYSINLGRDWTVITDPKIHKVTEERWQWGHKEIDDSKTIHFEVRIGDPHKARPKYYAYTCSMDECFDKVHPQQIHNLAVGAINQKSLLVEGGYIMVEKPIGREGAHNDLLISSNRTKFEPAIFTSMENFIDFHIVSAKNDYIILGVLHTDKETANLYVSNTKGNIFWLALSNVEKQTKDGKTNFAVDCVSFGDLAGVILCNQRNHTRISYTSGAEWSLIKKANVQLKDDKPYEDDASLRLQLSNQYTKQGWYMPNFKLLNDGKYGYAYSHGKFGDSFPKSPADKGLWVYMTRNGGVDWEQIMPGRHIYTATDYGRQVLSRLTKKFSTTDKLQYSGDFATKFTNFTFTDTPIMIDGILTEPGAHTPHFTIFGHVQGKSFSEHDDSWHIITVDATELVQGEEKCKKNDYVTTVFTTPDNNQQVLGMKRTFNHQNENAKCQNDEKYLNEDNALKIEPIDACTKKDYTCGYLYKIDTTGDEFKCIFDEDLHSKDLTANHLYWFDVNTKRWPMKIPSNKCKNDHPGFKQEFNTFNKEYLKGDDKKFGSGYKLVEKVTDEADRGDNYFGNDQNRGIGDVVKFQLSGKIFKKEKAVYDWFIESVDEDTSKYEEVTNKQTENNEYTFVCQRRARYRISVYLRSKDKNYSNQKPNKKEAIFYDSVALNCWNRLEDIVLHCTPVVYVGSYVNCRAWQTDQDAFDDPSLTKYVFSSYQSPTKQRVGYTNTGIGSTISFNDFTEVDYHADVTVTASNKIEKMEEEMMINVRPKLTGDNKPWALKFDLDLPIDVNDVDSVETAVVAAQVLEEKVKGLTFNNGDNTRNKKYKKYVWFPDMFKAPKSKGGKTTGVIMMAGSHSGVPDSEVPKHDNYLWFKTAFEKKSKSLLTKTKATYKYEQQGQEKRKVEDTPAVYYSFTNIRVVDLETDKEYQKPAIKNADSTEEADFDDQGQVTNAQTSSGGMVLWIILGVVASLAVLAVLGVVVHRVRMRKKYHRPEDYSPDDLGMRTHNTTSDREAIIQHDQLDHSM